MKVARVETHTIEAKRFSKPGEKVQNVRVDQNSTITQITPSGDEGMSAEFRLTINYTGIGFIKLEGQVIMAGEGDVAPALSEWRSSGNLPTATANVVHNAVMSHCMPTALLVSRDVQMPPPFPLPRIQLQKKSKPRPADGFEVA